ncbi:phytochrome E [Tanacetum coccineum]
MPDTAGRVRMPANNRVHSSTALQTHTIWQNAIGYDPYAPNKEDNKKSAQPQSSTAAEPVVYMSSIAPLVMEILLNNIDSMKLWGLVAHHHTKPRYISFPLRYACEFLIKSMGLQLYMELQLAEQKVEKRILRMQTTLCDMLL